MSKYERLSPQDRARVNKTFVALAEKKKKLKEASVAKDATIGEVAEILYPNGASSNQIWYLEERLMPLLNLSKEEALEKISTEQHISSMTEDELLEEVDW